MITVEPRNWREAREKFGKIRIGQIWMNRAVRNILIVERRDGDKFRMSDSRKHTHLVKERDLYKYWDLVR